MPDVLSPTSAFGSSADGYQEQSPTGFGINSPDLDPKTIKPKRRAISDVNHIFRIVGDLQMARREQNEKNGRIQSKLNSERPYDEAALKNEGLEYKSNFSTKPLSTTVGKVAARLTKSLQAARFLTAASLPESVPDSKKKSEAFRGKITDLIRKWPGWQNFCEEVATEDAVFGWATAAWLDEYSWKPEFFRQDRAFLPDGTKQTVDSVQFIAFLQYLMPHELAQFIENPKSAKTAGWEVENVVESINAARPQSIPAAQSAPYTDFRRLEDAIRESSVSLSLISGAKTIMLWHVFAVEIDGKVSHYIGDGNSKKLLFQKEDRFENTSECLALLSYEKAATLMGSKGIGREIYELSNALDRARNEAVDRLQLSGKIIVQGPANQIARFKLTVVGNVVLIPEGFTISQNRVEASVDEFLALENKLTQLLDQIAGGVTPKEFDRERVTTAEVNAYLSREEEKRDEITARFVTQFASGVITGMQRRIVSKKVRDEDAKRLREELLQIMSEEELEMLADQPALRTVEDFTMQEAQKIALIAQESRNDPLYDHRKVEEKKLTVLFGPDFANEVLLPENDPTVTAEQSRQQQLENTVLTQGQPVAVSPRDAHDVHIEVLKQALAPLAQQVGQQPNAEGLAVMQNLVQHWAEHFNFLQTSAIPKEQLAAMQKELTTVAQQIGEMQAQVEMQMQQQVQAEQELMTDPVAAGQRIAATEAAIAEQQAAPAA